ncbi:MAG: hypothetical protein NZ480_01705, partial [Bdellovibrionaceae bacterium]|nr:hypothetical protein [Pseudobdellovibrionaceae bacterium]MDW8189811.1 hypothetical protein [Pseudobdellovibrionaceae bacterium]
SLTKTKTLLLPFGAVNFWETGPRAPGSFVLSVKETSEKLVTHIIEACLSLLENRTPQVPGYSVCEEATPCYQPNFDEKRPYSWDLIKFIYLGESLRNEIPKGSFITALEKLKEVNSFVLDLLEQTKSDRLKLKEIKPFLERSEEIIQVIYQLSTDIRVIIDWYQTEKIRIPPGPLEQIYHQTYHTHFLLKQLIDFITSSPLTQDVKVDASP